MSAQVGLGVPFPKMLPITGTWTLPFATYLMLLTNRVVMSRINSKRYIGDSTGKAGTGQYDDLQINSRSHANFLENVPLAISLAAIAELNGADKKILNYTLATLFVARILHVEVGLRGKENAAGWGRPVGHFATSGIISGLAAYSAYLVKGYWGF